MRVKHEVENEVNFLFIGLFWKSEGDDEKKEVRNGDEKNSSWLPGC